MWKHGECSRFLPQNYCLHLGFSFQSHILRRGTLELSSNEINCVLKLLYKQLEGLQGVLGVGVCRGEKAMRQSRLALLSL